MLCCASRAVLWVECVDVRRNTVGTMHMAASIHSGSVRHKVAKLGVLRTKLIDLKKNMVFKSAFPF